MTLPTEVEQPKPSAFDHSGETDDAAYIILMSASGFNVATRKSLDESKKAQWQGVVTRIWEVGPDHGKAILRVLNPFALDVGLSPEIATVVIEDYCEQHGLTVPKIPDNEKTIAEGVFRSLFYS